MKKIKKVADVLLVASFILVLILDFVVAPLINLEMPNRDWYYPLTGFIFAMLYTAERLREDGI